MNSESMQFTDKDNYVAISKTYQKRVLTDEWEGLYSLKINQWPEMVIDHDCFEILKLALKKIE